MAALLKSPVFWVVTIVVLLAIGGGGAVGAWYAYGVYQERNALFYAEESMANGAYGAARQNYEFYLARNPDDAEILEKYAAVCLLVEDRRRQSLERAGTAYFQLARQEPGNRERVDRVLAHYRQHGMWERARYAADFFLATYPNDDALQFALAEATFEMGQINEAADLFQTLIDAGRAPVEAYLFVAEIREDANLGQQAEAVVAQAREAFPGHVRLAVHDTRLALEAGDQDAARRANVAALEADASDYEALNDAAQLAVDAGELDRAEALARNMIEVDALRQEGYIRLATVLDQQGNLDAAVEAAESIERPIRANHPDLFVLQFEFLLAKLRFDEAEAVARQLARAYPRLTDLKRFLDARLQLSRSTRADEGEQREMAAEAARSLTAVVESNPGYARARYFLAMAHLQAGARDEAEEALAQYIDQQPEDRNAQLLYQSLFATGEEALAEMAASAQVLLDSPATPVGQLLAAAVPLARRLQRTPEDKDIYAQAVALLDRATQVDANDSSPHRLRAQVELWRGDVDAAAAAIERARETGAEESDLYMLQAAEAIARENVSAAAALAERALAADDVVPADVRNWARFLQSQGQFALAVDVLDRASASADAAMQADYAAEKVVLAVRAGEVDQATTFVSADLLATDQAARDRALGALIDFALEEVRTGSPNNAESARSIVAFVLEQSPDMPRARLAEALLGLRERPPQLARAEEAAYAAVETADLAGDAYLILFEVAKRRGQYARALTFAQRAREAGETLAGQLAEADAQLQLGEYGVARALAEQVLEGAPNQPQALEILAQAASVAGLRSVAQEALARLRQVQQTTVDVAALAAWIEGTTGTGADVIANLERAVAENPDDFAAVHALARAYARGGDPRRGAERLEALGENVDDDPQPWTAAGQMYLQVPRDAGLSDASSAFARALFIQDDYAPALRGMIDFQLRSGNPGAASGLLERYLALEPSNAEAWHQLAVLTMLFPGRRDRALDAVNQAIELEERPEFFSTRGQVHAQLGNDADAVADLRRFSAAGGEMTAALDITLAESLAANGEGDAARGFLEDAARKVASDDAESQARIDALRQRLDEESAV